MLINAVELLSSPAFGLAYHVILLVTLALLYSLSRAFGGRSESPRAARWVLAASWILMLRILGVAVAMLGPAVGLAQVPLVSSFAPFVTLAGVILFGWAILFDRSHAIGDRLLLVLLGIALISLAVSLVSAQLAPLLPETVIELLERAWLGLGLIISLATVVLLFVRRPRQWPIGGSAFGVLFLGFGFQLLTITPDIPVAGFVRPAELLAYPLITLACVRALINEMPRFEAEQRAARVSQAKAETNGRSSEAESVRSLISLLSIHDPDNLGHQAVRTLAEIVRAEYCLLVTPPDDRDQFAIDVGYDLIREQYVPGSALDGDNSPVLLATLTQQRSLNLSTRSRSPDVITLQSVLQLPSTGPILFVPIASSGQLLGGFVLLSPYARRSWTPEQRALAESFAGELGTRFLELRTLDSSAMERDNDAYSALTEARNRIQQLEQENIQLFEEAHAPGANVEADTEELFEARMRLDQAEETILILEAEIERLKSAYVPAPEVPTTAEIDHLTSELQSALQELVEARAEITRLRSETVDSRGGFDEAQIDPEAIASIAQELRQPMSSILGYTDLLLGESVGLLGAMQRKFLERARTGIERMGALLNDLIQVTALESGHLDLTPTQVDLLRCVEDAVNQVGPALRERDLALRMDFPETVPAIMGDNDAVSQIVLHLLNNAIAASPEGDQVVLSARVEQSEDHGFLMLSVTDHGEGIPVEDLGRVFQRLYRGDRVIIQGVGDGGIGLSLVKALSEALGGRVWVESEVGAGSTFTVLLPLTEPNAQDLQTGA
ncbi:MAG: ATP-binding protein [Anaerolineales bacterium]